MSKPEIIICTSCGREPKDFGDCSAGDLCPYRVEVVSLGVGPLLVIPKRGPIEWVTDDQIPGVAMLWYSDAGIEIEHEPDLDELLGITVAFGEGRTGWEVVLSLRGEANRVVSYLSSKEEAQRRAEILVHAIREAWGIDR